MTGGADRGCATNSGALSLTTMISAGADFVVIVDATSIMPDPDGELHHQAFLYR
jgi:hypothetical protein